MDKDKINQTQVQENGEQPDVEQTQERPGDWILELFSPSYANAADILEGKHPIEEEGPKVRFVSAFDPQSIRNVYERVHRIMKIDEELKKEKEQAGKTVSPVKKRMHAENAADSQSVDLNDSSLWNSEELSVLRNVFRAAKSQICSLEVKLRQTQRHNSELEEKLAAQSKTLETKSSKLIEATKANHRLKIHCDELEVEVKGTEMKLAAVTDMWKELDQERLRVMKETQEARIALDKQRMAVDQLHLQLKEARQETVTEKLLAEENAKTRYEHQLFKLEDQLRCKEEELEQERVMHARDAKALQHLRNHFATLPLSHLRHPGGVDTDQVSRVDHIGL